jgi:hypothetical protein
MTVTSEATTAWCEGQQSGWGAITRAPFEAGLA